MKKVLCISECCCDLIFGGLDRLPAPGEEVYGTHFSVQTGGGANTAVLLARCGVPTSFWTALGDDFAGNLIRETLSRSGVRLISHRQAARRTPVSAVLSTDADRAFASFAEPGRLIEDADALEAAIRDADIVHTYLGYCAAFPIPRLCEKHGRLLSVDTSFCDADPERLESVLPHCDYWKGNEGEARLLTGKSDAEEALLLLSGRVRKGAVVTCGAHGSIVRERGGALVRQPAIDCGPFVDACGAGDAFAAGMLAGLSRSESFPDCLMRGAQLAGTVVTAYGGCPETLEIPRR